jgi:integrase
MNYEFQLGNYLGKLEEKVGEHNAELIREYNTRQAALPDEPGLKRQMVSVHRISSISQKLDNHPLDKITEKEIIKLNTKMRNKNMSSASDYRKQLKQFLKLVIKPRLSKDERADLLDLLDSEFFKTSSKHSGKNKPVDPEEFWEEQQIVDYLKASKNHSVRQLAFAGLWLSIGGRPQEILNLKKSDFEDREGKLIIRIRGTKTDVSNRVVILEPSEAKQLKEYLKPRFLEMNENEKIVPICWTQQKDIHHFLCDKINLPKGKSRKLYISRKMTLTRWYNTYGLAKAAQMAGHIVGARAMKHYVALSESDLLTDKPKTSIAKKTCPNCNTENDASETQCYSCHSPLNKQAFTQILNQNLNEKINAHLELIKKDLTIKMLTLNQQPIKQEIIASPSR